MPSRGVVRRDRKSHSNLRPKHKHTKHYLKHYWPYLPMVTLLLFGLWVLKPALSSSNRSVLAVATNVNNQTLLASTNIERESANSSPLALNQKLSAAAQAKAQDMVSKNYWSHNTPDGSSPWTFVTDHGYQYQKAGENLAYGFTTSSEVISGWMNSPSHRANLLDTSYTEVGFGSATSSDFNHSGPSTVVVALYGRSITEPPITNTNTLDAAPNSFKTASAYNSEQQVVGATHGVNRLGILTNQQYPWLTPLVTFVVGAALATFALKHGLGIKRSFRKGERFVVKHPLLDTVLVAIIIIGFMLTSQIGTIL